MQVGFQCHMVLEKQLVHTFGARVHPDYRGRGLNVMWLRGPNIEEYKNQWQSFTQILHFIKTPAADKHMKTIAGFQTQKEWVSQMLILAITGLVL